MRLVMGLELLFEEALGQEGKSEREKEWRILGANMTRRGQLIFIACCVPKRTWARSDHHHPHAPGERRANYRGVKLVA